MLPQPIYPTLPKKYRSCNSRAVYFDKMITREYILNFDQSARMRHECGKFMKR